MKQTILACIMGTTILWGGFGHPHVFMDTRIEVTWDDGGMTGFWLTWRFDKVFTAGILMDFDADKDGRLSPAEVAEIEDKAFANLVNYNYFVYIRSSQGLHRPSRVRNFSAYLEGQRLYYRFFVPYSLPIPDGQVDLNVAVYDDTFFCAIGYAEGTPVLFSASTTLNGSYAIREDRGIRIDYPANDGTQGSTFPRQLMLTIRRES